MRHRTIIYILMLSAVMHAHAQNISGIQGNLQFISGAGTDDAEAMAGMVAAVGSAYSNSLDSRMAVSYSDEFRSASHKISEGGQICRYINRSAVEDIFSTRKKQAGTILANAMAAEKNGDPGRAAMYYYWCVALYSSLPGDNIARIEDSKAGYQRLSDNHFPNTVASNISSKAELIFKIIGKPAAGPVVGKTGGKAEVRTAPSVDIKERVDTIPAMMGIRLCNQPLIESDATLLEKHAPIDVSGVQIGGPNPEKLKSLTNARPQSRSWRCLLTVGATVWQTPGIRVMGGPVYNRRYGAYVAGTWNCRTSSYSYVLGKDGMLEGGGAFWGDGHSRVSDWSVTMGGIWMAGSTNSIGVYSGLGYGSRCLTLRDIDGAYAMDAYHSVNSIIGEAGVVGRIRGFIMTTGVTFSQRYVQLSASVGYVF